MRALFELVGLITLAAASTIFRAEVLSILWGWFVIPIFGLQPLGLAQAVGVATVVDLLTHQYVPAKDRDVWMPIVVMFLMPAAALLVGWIAKQYL